MKLILYYKMNNFKPLSISLSPNVQKDDVKLAFNLILRPWLWLKHKKTNSVALLEEELRQYLGVKYAVSFNSGRSALYAILKSLNVQKNENVFLQAFTCNAAINPILWSEALPAYVDCDTQTFNIDVEDLKNKIEQQKKQGKPARILMVQHTFGLPANMDKVLDIVRQNNLILIEDAAHALGAEYHGKKVGTFGNAGFFSFSRDKVISSVYGGLAVTNDDTIGESLKKLQKQFGKPSMFWTFQQLLHPILLQYFILPIYDFFDLGKIFLVLSQWLHILSKAVHWKEKRGQRPDYFPKALPNALAALALNQFRKLDKFYEHRRRISRYYYENLKGTAFNVSDELLSDNLSLEKVRHSFLRFTVKHKQAHEIIYEAWHLPDRQAGKQNILLGDWYTTVIAPFDTKLNEMHYQKGMCPNAEWLATRTLNLPTHINVSQKDAERVVSFLKQFK